MNTIESTPTLHDAQQVLASAVAHRVEKMSTEELQALSVRAQIELQNENVSLQNRMRQLEAESRKQSQLIEKLEAERVRLYYRLARLECSEKDWEDFDPREYTVPAEQMLADMDQLLAESGETPHG